MSAAARRIAQQYASEIYAEHGVEQVIIIVRLGVRLRTVGRRNLALDDLGMVFVIVCLILNVVAAHNIISSGGTNSHMSDDVRASLTPHQISKIVEGSKWFYFGTFMYATTTWLIKECMAIFLGRMTTGLRRHKWVIVVHVLNTGSLLVYTLALLLICLPTRRRWQIVPAPDSNCQTDSIFNEALSTPLSIVVDVMLLAIPIPLLWGSSMPLRRKLGLCLLLCGGVFTIIAILLRTTFSIKGGNTLATTPAVWVGREYFIAIFVANAPLIKPAFSRNFWHCGPYTPPTYTPQKESLSDGIRTVPSGKVEYSHSERDLEFGRVFSHGREPSTNMSDLKIQRHQEFEVSSQIELTGRESEDNLESVNGMRLGPRVGWNTSEVHGPPSSRNSSEHERM